MNMQCKFRSGDGASVHLHIERLVVEGLPLEGFDKHMLEAGLEGEMVRLLTETGLKNQNAAAISTLKGKAIHLAQNGSHSEGMGRQIARSVYDALNGLAGNVAATRKEGINSEGARKIQVRGEGANASAFGSPNSTAALP